jgi:hypothetical protein
VTTEPDPPPRRTVDWGAIGLSALGVLSAWLAVTGLSPTVRAMSARAPLVEFRPSALIPAPLAISLFALAAIALIPRRHGGSARVRHDADKTFWRKAAWLFYLAAAGALTAIVIAPAGRMIVSGIMADRGYDRCPPSDTIRHAPLRWHLPDGVCP